jgi:hypothetical protein
MIDDEDHGARAHRQANQRWATVAQLRHELSAAQYVALEAQDELDACRRECGHCEDCSACLG